jgi:hypothetical protein
MKGRDDMTRSPSPAGGAEASEEEKTMTCKRITKLALALLLVLPAAAMAQTTTPGAGIDLEIYNPVDGSDIFCADAGVPFWANVYVRPGSDATTCSLACGTVDGGPANIGTGVIDVGFDPTLLSVVGAETNPAPGFAAVDGLLQTQNVAAGRIGWALAGDWVVDGDPTSGLNNPCAMQKLDTAGWVFRVQFQSATGAPSNLTLLQQPDFQLSFADMCGSPAFTVAGGGIDEVNGATYVGPCSNILFIDGFESGNTSAWSLVAP